MLGARERKQLTDDVQYLNLEEMKKFCRTHELPLQIHVERPDGRLLRTPDRDRKDVVLARILQFAIRGRRSGPTVYPMSVVAKSPLPTPLTARTRVRYGQYEKKNREFVNCLVQLTDGAFRTGMIARLVLRDFWTAGKAPTMKQLAGAWLQANRDHTSPRPEGAYLADLARGTAGSDWKGLRVRRAARALRQLESLIAARESC
ncbi:MAG: hypothetical protein AAF581_16425 [Planctomycetota bacterium]